MKQDELMPKHKENFTMFLEGNESPILKISQGKRAGDKLYIKGVKYQNI